MLIDMRPKMFKNFPGIYSTFIHMQRTLCSTTTTTLRISLVNFFQQSCFTANYTIKRMQGTLTVSHDACTSNAQRNGKSPFHVDAWKGLDLFVMIIVEKSMTCHAKY